MEPNNPLAKAYHTLFNIDNYSLILLMLEYVISPAIINSLPIQRNRDLKSGTALIRGACYDIIHKKRAEVSPAKDIVSVALAAKVEFTDDDLVEQSMTFLVAGRETSSAVLSRAIYIVCQRPDIQTRLRQEIHSQIPRAAFDRDGFVVTADMVENCKYLHGFTSEILRLYPSAPLIIREARIDTTICEVFIPKGQMISISPWGLNSSRKIYGLDARDFRPERWLEDPSGMGGADPSWRQFGFSTFSAGPRSCIGMAFARGEIDCLVAAVVGAFEIEFDPAQSDKDRIFTMLGGLSTKPKDGWKCQMRRASWVGKSEQEKMP